MCFLHFLKLEIVPENINISYSPWDIDSDTRNIFKNKLNQESETDNKILLDKDNIFQIVNIFGNDYFGTVLSDTEFDGNWQAENKFFIKTLISYFDQ